MVTVVLLKFQVLWDVAICHWANCLSLYTAWPWRWR